MVNLRNFLYLDTEAVENYLAALDGSVSTDELTRSERVENDKTARAGVNQFLDLGAQVGGRTTTEISQVRRVNDVARFEQLYQKLSHADGIYYLDSFDAETWDDIHRGDIVEVEAVINLPDFYEAMGLAEIFAPVIQKPDLLNSLTTDSLDPKLAGMIDVMAQLANSRPFYILFEASNTDGFQFAGKLTKSFLRTSFDQLAGEATVLGKVQKLVPKGKKETIFPLPKLSERKQSHQTRAGRNHKQPMVIPLKGPAMIIYVVGVYQ